MAEGGYRTLKAGAQAEGEFVDRKSRFIAQLVHVEGEAGAAEHLAAVRSLHHDARHNVPAWILADGTERCSDDGEPSRTAGMPALDVLRGAGLADVSCVVTRYFGGTLLGPGGLVRAYAAAVQEAVRAAEEQGQLVEMCLVTRVIADIPYALHDRVRHLAETSGGRIQSSLFAEDVQLTIAFRAGEEAPFVAAMRELAAGEELCRVCPPAFAEL